VKKRTSKKEHQKKNNKKEHQKKNNKKEYFFSFLNLNINWIIITTHNG